ncbi:AI-2E family transporter [Salinisphaera sp. SPP-AMP-43]|uniref:AI-2E family transporter n=1 Tax=Salinisphaera sp. SPP-AMP-43 TaxID=3121288 RepID=UPI003C6E9AE8
MSQPMTTSDEVSEQPTLQLFSRPLSVRSIVLSALLILALGYTLYFARFVCIPIALALLLNMLLGPLVTWAQRRHVPRSLSAFLIIASFGAVAGYGIYMLTGPAEYWINRAPQAFSSFDHKTSELQQQIQNMNESTKELKQAATKLIGKASEQTVQINDKGLRSRIVTNLQWTGSILVMTLIMLYFMLASHGSLFKQLMLLMPSARSRSNAVRIVRHLQADISRYLATVTLINISLGAIASLVLWLIGLADPVLWGVVVGVFNFAPYIGAAISLGLITLASFVTFDTLSHVVMAPLAVFALNVLEGNFITPLIHGHRFAMSPLMVFVALFFWGWLWGVAGMLMAVPLLLVCKVTCDHIQELRPFGRALAR